MVSMARPLLADPDWVAKARRDDAGAINTCIACNQACLDHVFENKRASCLVNPRACHETELRIEPAATPRRYAVVGAGPAGLACAATLAERGHAVTLFDRAEAIGGQFNMAKRIPGKEEFHETLRYFDRRLARCRGDAGAGPGSRRRGPARFRCRGGGHRRDATCPRPSPAPTTRRCSAISTCCATTPRSGGAWPSSVPAASASTWPNSWSSPNRPPPLTCTAGTPNGAWTSPCTPPVA